eukprot:TRINITY_DN3045_c0_g1_i1.p1 TRINITY_DN3045_c0_g1~~TRINITY_DN3045_c0_g1_i1.p1  ORF type:complete len:623 (-),score=184.43 TRINITY_DN3045_c0_g1_i1:3196-4785(-)
MARNIERKQTEYFILMENCSAGSLFKFIKEREENPIPQKTLLIMFASICKAVRELHKMNPPVTHRDLKIENILIGEDRQLKLCDFGSCITRAQAYTTQEEIADEEERIQKYSTPSYRAPEMCDLWSKTILDVKTDIWALGCIFFILLFFRHPFPEGARTQIVAANYVIPKKHPYSERLVEMLKAMLKKDSRKRPSCDDLIRYSEHLMNDGDTPWKDFMNKVHPKQPKKKQQVKKGPQKTTKKAKEQAVVVDEDFAKDFEADFGSFGGSNPTSPKKPSSQKPSVAKTESLFEIPEVFKGSGTRNPVDDSKSDEEDGDDLHQRPPSDQDEKNDDDDAEESGEEEDSEEEEKQPKGKPVKNVAPDPVAGSGLLKKKQAPRKPNVEDPEDEEYEEEEEEEWEEEEEEEEPPLPAKATKPAAVANKPASGTANSKPSGAKSAPPAGFNFGVFDVPDDDAFKVDFKSKAKSTSQRTSGSEGQKPAATKSPPQAAKASTGNSAKKSTSSGGPRTSKPKQPKPVDVVERDEDEWVAF